MAQKLLEQRNISHSQNAKSFADAKEALIHKVQTRGNLPYASVPQQIQLIEELSSFELGRFLIERGGLNGRWIQYIIDNTISSNPLEAYLLTKAPVCLATRERFHLFKSAIQETIKEGCSFAAVPCGVMAELLDLSYAHVKNFTLTGVDIDPESFVLATERAEKMGLNSRIQFLQRDAWNIHEEARFDLISSNGLTIYEKDDVKVTELYRAFHKALNKDGTLVTSFLVPPSPPREGPILQDFIRQKLIFADILEVKWQSFRTESTVLRQLNEAGFSNCQFLYDQRRLFPTVIATKRLSAN